MSPRGTRRLSTTLRSAVVCLLVAPLAHAEDPFVARVAAEVSQDEVTATIQTLQDFGTRFSYTTQCDDAADWIYATLESYGLEVSYDPFDYGGKTMRNVIGRLEGSAYPDDVFIVGAHYDSMSEMPTVSAPGADDNASGVAAVLEAARILSAYEPESTVEFICYGGEEQGRRGSQHHAAEASGAGTNIVGMVNLDMIGYWPASSDQELDIGRNAASGWLADVAEDATRTYTTKPVHNWPDTGACYDDHVSYWNEGYDAIVLMDCYEAHLGLGGESTPHYHRTSDTISTLDLGHTTEAVRATVATMTLLASTFLYVDKVPATADVGLAWNGGVAPYVVEVSTVSDFSSGVEELTPPGGTTDTAWTHAGVLYDGVDYYYRVRKP